MLGLIMSADIPATLQELTELLEKLSELREWSKLAEQEARPEVPPSFRLNNHIEEDARTAYAAFVSKALSTRIALNDPNLTVTPAQKQEWHNMLDRMQRQVRIIHSTESFIKP